MSELAFIFSLLMVGITAVGLYRKQSSRSFDAFRFINAYSCFFHASAFGST